MPAALWELIPKDMQQPVTSLQQAGALVMTVFERIDIKYEELEGKVIDSDEDVDSDFVTIGQGQMVERIASKLASLGMGEPVRTPSVSSLPSLPHSMTSTRSTSLSRLEPFEPLSPPLGLSDKKMVHRLLEMQTGIPSTESASPTSSPSETLVPLQEQTALGSPTLTTPELGKGSRRSTARNSSFHRPPRDPRISYWRAEVSYLRGDAMVRLRHGLMKVGVEWKDVCAREARRFHRLALL